MTNADLRALVKCLIRLKAEHLALSKFVSGAIQSGFQAEVEAQRRRIEDLPAVSDALANDTTSRLTSALEALTDVKYQG